MESCVVQLAQLVGPGGLLGDAYDGDRPVLLRESLSVEGLPGGKEIDALIECSLQRWPYFTIMKEGVRPDGKAIFQEREVGGKKLNGFMDPEGVRKVLADGATLRLGAVSDWNSCIREMATEIVRAFPGNLNKSYIFYTPAGQRGMVPHSDPARVIVIQVEGEKEWTLFAVPEERGSFARVDIDPDSVVDTFTMQPGDVLYLPHSHPHAATATSSTSTHVTFAFSEPTPLQLAECALKEWQSGVADNFLAAELAASRNVLADAVVENFRKYLRDANPAGLLESTVANFAVR
jgi:ribosomal protein L16 Arg81 hydroxylase